MYKFEQKGMKKTMLGTGPKIVLSYRSHGSPLGFPRGSFHIILQFDIKITILVQYTKK